MQLIKNKEKIGNILFVAAIVIEVVIMMTDHMSSFTIPLRGRFAQLAFVLFGCKILTTKYTKKTVDCHYNPGSAWYGFLFYNGR